MTSPDPGAPTPETALQFDEAERGTAAPVRGVTCGSCGKSLTGVYHMLNATVLCANCRQRLERDWNGGSGSGRFGRALLYGLGGAVAGAAVYYAVLALTNMEIGLIAILVGYLVGKGVHKGSGGRGGFTYQALAMVLTYFAIVSTYIPLILQGLHEQPSMLMTIAVAAIVPFMSGISNIIGLLIIGFAIYEAWKLNRRPMIAFTGPFQVGGATATSA